MAGRSPQKALTGTNASTGSVDVTRPLTPPICSSNGASGSPNIDGVDGLAPAFDDAEWDDFSVG
ncbi:hypothetical protein [Dietzia timorensis]|uniref:hypothetical protein n=1 Tax=Dietzia timorensis TaxID=499555 RepID=UPI0039E1F8C7